MNSLWGSSFTVGLKVMLRSAMVLKSLVFLKQGACTFPLHWVPGVVALSQLTRDTSCPAVEENCEPGVSVVFCYSNETPEAGELVKKRGLFWVTVVSRGPTF